jgi:hypothetical protein
MAYICLNVFYAKPKTYDTVRCTKSPKQPPNSDRLVDYRCCYSYQKMVLDCTDAICKRCETQPHREAFGVRSNTFSSAYMEDMLGKTLFDAMKLNKDHVPTTNDYEVVRAYLQNLSLCRTGFRGYEAS